MKRKYDSEVGHDGQSLWPSIGRGEAEVGVGSYGRDRGRGPGRVIIAAAATAAAASVVVVVAAQITGLVRAISVSRLSVSL